jgi:hypothetical protein
MGEARCCQLDQGARICHSLHVYPMNFYPIGFILLTLRAIGDPSPDPVLADKYVLGLQAGFLLLPFKHAHT